MYRVVIERVVVGGYIANRGDLVDLWEPVRDRRTYVYVGHRAPEGRPSVRLRWHILDLDDLDDDSPLSEKIVVAGRAEPPYSAHWRALPHAPLGEIWEWELPHEVPFVGIHGGMWQKRHMTYAVLSSLLAAGSCCWWDPAEPPRELATLMEATPTAVAVMGLTAHTGYKPLPGHGPFLAHNDGPAMVNTSPSLGRVALRAGDGKAFVVTDDWLHNRKPEHEIRRWLNRPNMGIPTSVVGRALVPERV